MSRFASLLLFGCAACAGPARQLVLPSEAAPQPVVFADDKLRTVVPVGWSGVKDARVTDGNVVTTYELLLRGPDGADIGIKTYPAAPQLSALAMADRLRDGVLRQQDARADELEFSEGAERRSGFGYEATVGADRIAGKVVVLQLGDLGVAVIGQWKAGAELHAVFDAVVEALALSPP